MIAGVIKSQPAGDARIVRSVERLLRDLQVVAREPRVVISCRRSVLGRVVMWEEP